MQVTVFPARSLKLTTRLASQQEVLTLRVSLLLDPMTGLNMFTYPGLCLLNLTSSG